MSVYAPVVSAGGAAQKRYDFTPTLMPTTVGDWAISYTTQTGVMIVDGSLAQFEITVAGTPTFTTAAAGTMRIAGLPVTPVSSIGMIQIQEHTANVTYPSSSTILIGRLASDFSAITLVGLRSAGSLSGLSPTGLVSGALVRFVLSGLLRVG